MTASPEEPRCPFCYYKIDQPTELQAKKLVEFPVGACGHCGAVYVYDATGHNMGAAFIEVLLFACNYDSDLAFSLSSLEDYTDAVVGNYDIVTHSIVSEKIYNDRYIRGALLFIKLIDQFKEMTGEKVKERLKSSLPIAKTRLRSEIFSKDLVRQYVSEKNHEGLGDLALQDSRVLNELQRMLYTPDEQSRWRVIEFLGIVCKKVGKVRPDLVSKLLGNLLQSAAYPGSSAWGSLEAVGAIISINTDLFGDFCLTLIPFINQQTLWKEVTWAIGTIAAVNPKPVKRAFRTLLPFLESSSPALRGHAAWALGHLGNNEAIEQLKKLGTDDEELALFRNSQLEKTTVSQLSKEAIKKLGKPKP